MSFFKRIFSGKSTVECSEIIDNVDINGVLELENSLSGWFNSEQQELFKGFPISAEDTVLDIGCGDGGYLTYCAQFGPAVICADVDEQKIKRLEASLHKTNARSVKALVTNANPLELDDSSVNRVVAMEVLEHVEDPAQFLSELVRVGSSGALYLITVPDPIGENIQKQLAPDVYFQHPNHIRIFERKEFENLVIDSGLVIEHRTSYGFYWSLWWFMFWACKQDLSPPWHPILESWTQTWGLLLSSPDGPRIKRALDDAMPKSQVIIARKPE